MKSRKPRRIGCYDKMSLLAFHLKKRAEYEDEK